MARIFSKKMARTVLKTVAVKQKLSSQTVELRDRKDQVQKLHNQLIKQKDQEKELLKISDAHKTQNKLVQKLQSQNDKVLKLEDACKKQEKVIGKMERLLANKGPKDVSGSTEALGDENKRLRGQLDDMREQNRLMTLAKGINDEENEERLQLYETVEKTESRVASLEQQLAENARRWGHEKADLLNKIQEAEPGLRRTSPVRKPNKATGYSYDSSMRNNPRKYSKASMKHQQLVHSTRDPYDY